MQERLTLENYGVAAVDVLVGYEFDADFLDIFEVKSQSYEERDLDFLKSITPLRTSRWYDTHERSFRFAAEGGGFQGSSLVWFENPASPAIGRCISRRASSPARGGRSPHASSCSARGSWQKRDSARFFQGARSRVTTSQRTWFEGSPIIGASFERMPSAYRRSLSDLAALRMRVPDGDHEAELPAAGLPWFMTVFGRDTLLTSLQIMPLGDDLARAALRVLAHAQATEHDPARDAEPGRST